MDNILIGIDVSKDRLDVAVRPSGEKFVVERNAAGLERAGGATEGAFAASCRAGGDRGF